MLYGSIPAGPHLDAPAGPRAGGGTPHESPHGGEVDAGDTGAASPWRSRSGAGEDFERPSSARVYDYLLGGAVNGEVDRALGREFARHEPVVVGMARESRSFLRRAVGFLAHAGVDQFLDLGSGIPSMGNVHEVARRLSPTARVAYVDVDPVAVGRGETSLAGDPGSSITLADLRDVDGVLGAPGVTDTLDLSRPVALTLFSVLQHVPDADDPAGLLRRYLAALAPGSALALSHVTDDDPRVDVASIGRLTGAYARGAMQPRSLAEVEPLVAAVDLVEPGLGWSGMWRPEVPPREDLVCGHHAAVGFRRPDTAANHPGV